METHQTMENQQIEQNDSSLHEPEVVIDVDTKQYYLTLLSMFPNVDSSYIREICKNPPFNLDRNDHLQMFVEHLLRYNDHSNNRHLSEPVENYDDIDFIEISGEEERANDEILSQMLYQQNLEIMEIERQNEEKVNELLLTEFLKNDQEILDEKTGILENILPDANPEFLKKFVEKNHEDSISLANFIESKLINKDYEKRDKYYAEMRTKEKIEQYTTGFTVEKFMQQFPEPFEYFENIERKGSYQDKAFSFLKIRYPNYPEQYLTNIYSANHYNLSLTDKQLQTLTGSKNVNLVDINVDDVGLLSEIAFILNKNSIKVYLDQIQKQEEKELQVFRAKNLLLTCQCCYDELKPTECIECDNSHIFCRRCVIKGTNLVISNAQTSVQCFVGCNKEINLNVLRKVLPQCIFDMLLKKRQEAEVEAAQLQGLATCPFCPYQMELAPQIKIFTCKNPECMKITCRYCSKLNHLPLKCEDVLNEHKGRLYIEEEMSKALIRNCYKCQKPFVKNEGCNFMTCPCGAKMCYICKRPYINSHNISHGYNCSQNSVMFDKQLVESTRAEAIEKLRKDFPDMNIPKV